MDAHARIHAAVAAASTMHTQFDRVMKDTLRTFDEIAAGPARVLAAFDAMMAQQAQVIEATRSAMSLPTPALDVFVMLDRPVLSRLTSDHPFLGESDRLARRVAAQQREFADLRRQIADLQSK